MRARNGQSGFSLLEMLIVVSIIAMLTSLMFIGIGKMQFIARRTVCQNNMKTLAKNVIEYTSFINGGRLPSFDYQPSMGALGDGKGTNSLRVADEWVWALGYVDGIDPYYGISTVTKIYPPRDSHAVLRCPSDTNYIMNAQRALTSYWAPPLLSDLVLSRITRRARTPMFFEADPINLSGNCGCRFHYQESPKEAAIYHDGGSNCAYMDGSVRIIYTKTDRLIDRGAKVKGSATVQPLPKYFVYLTDGRRAQYPRIDGANSWQSTWVDYNPPK